MDGGTESTANGRNQEQDRQEGRGDYRRCLWCVAVAVVMGQKAYVRCLVR